jgi:SAM-dependent methyltransferase/uncharacterized protein YbaR (Trm112 family)
MSLALTLVCPGCRTRTAERLDVRTLERRGDELVCECGLRYPVVDEVPIVLPDPTASFVEDELDPAAQARLVVDGPDDAPYPRLLEHLSTYLDAHWGDRAAPADPTAYAMAQFAARLAALPHVEAAVELGCSAGRIVAELAQRADLVLGLELSLGSVRRARRLLDGEDVAFARRMIGRHYATATISPGDRTVAGGRRQLVCGDALDPPLIPEVYDRVVALNLLDSVARPRQLLRVIAGLCKPGGEVILSSPFAWASHVMDEHERFGGLDPAAEVRALLGPAFTVVEEAEVPWTLRRDARSTVSYRTYWLRARKG